MQRLKQAHHSWLAAPALLLCVIALGAVIHYALTPEPSTILVLAGMLVIAFGMEMILLLLRDPVGKSRWTTPPPKT